EARGVLQCDVSAHRVAEQRRVGGAEVLEQRGEVALERTGAGLGLVRVAMAPEVEGDDVKALGQDRGDIVPPVGVGAAAVEEHEGGPTRLAVMEGVEVDTFEGRRGEAFGARHERAQYRTGPDREGVRRADSMRNSAEFDWNRAGKLL